MANSLSFSSTTSLVLSDDKDDDGDDEVMDLIERFDCNFECSIATFELSSSPCTDSRRGTDTEDNHILVLNVRLDCLPRTRSFKPTYNK